MTASTINELSDNTTPENLLPTVYATKVRTLRTRAYVLDIPPKENKVEILHTLLGIELKVGRIRFACPDLSTARYIRVFARIGCRDFAIPYDITRISAAADELETAWQQTLLSLETSSRGLPNQQRGIVRSRILRSIRQAIAEIGPGEKIPNFRQSTKQRES